MAAALPVGYSSEAELLDVYLVRRVSAADLTERLSPQLPDGLRIISVQEVPLASPSLQSLVRMAEYRAYLAPHTPPAAVQRRVEELLATESLPWQRIHKDKKRSYDLRPLIDDIWIEDRPNEALAICMRLLLGSKGTGRPDDVLRALDYADDVQSVRRTSLIIEQPASRKDTHD